jgi:glutathione peroxidase
MTTPLEQIPVHTVDGQPSSLGAYAGKVRLIVNVASKCGLTPQYAALEAMYRKYHAKGFEVLAFPANQFAGQEPGTDAEIKGFCTSTYDVSFPLFSKIVVTGATKHPLYAELTRAQPDAKTLPGADFRKALSSHGITPGERPEVLWNFEKFLVDRSGAVIERFAPDVPPDAEMVVAAVERALG